MTLIAVCKDKFSKGFPNPAATPDFEVLELCDALGREYSTDAHLVTYVVDRASKQPRIKKSSLVKFGASIRVHCLFCDVDNPDHGDWTEALRSMAREREAELRVLQSVGVYETAHGLRYIQPIEPVPVEDAERHLARWLDELRAAGVDADPTCKDWTRHYRLPNVMRGGARYRSPFVSLSKMRQIELPALPLIAVPTHHVAEFTSHHDTTEKMRRARAYVLATPPAIEGQRGDVATYTLCTTLARGFDLSDSEAMDCLSEWNSRCSPPWSECELESKIERGRESGTEAIGGRLEQRRLDAPPSSRSEPPPHTDADAPPVEWLHPVDGNGRPAGLPIPPRQRAERGESEWPEPDALDGELLALERFNDEQLLPVSLRPWLLDIGERMQVPIEYLAAAAVISLSAVVGRRCGVRPKRYDDWLEVPNLWGGVVGPPGYMKTPAVREVLRPIHRLAKEADDRYQEEAKKNGWDEDVLEAKREAQMKRIKGAVRSKDDATITDAQNELEALKVPPPPRYVVNDATVEKLGELLNENPRGLLVFRDELSGFLQALQRDGHDHDKKFYLEAWNGKDSFDYDRIGRGRIHIDAACVSIFGTIQPGPLGKYIRDAMGNSQESDGLAQRFQVLVYPDVSPEWHDVDRFPDKNKRECAYRLFQQLDQTHMVKFGAEVDDYSNGIPHLRFDDAAQEVFRDWRAALERKSRDPRESPAIQAHLSKYRKLMPSLALLFHLSDIAEGVTAPGPITERSSLQAFGWCEVLESHARRIYGYAGAAMGTRQASVRALTERMVDLPDPFTLRDLRQKRWSGLDGEAGPEAVQTLVKMNWLRQAQVAPKRGPKTIGFLRNPRLETRWNKQDGISGDVGEVANA